MQNISWNIENTKIFKHRKDYNLMPNCEYHKMGRTQRDVMWFGDIVLFCEKALECPYGNGRSFELDGYINPICMTGGETEKPSPIEKSVVNEVEEFPIANLTVLAKLNSQRLHGV